MSSEIVVPETPNWLQELEAKREKRLKARLAHESGAGAPCLKCGDKCPGLDLHFWRKCCKICKCSKEEHEVQDDDLYGWAQFQLLGNKPNKIKTKIVLPGKKDEVELDWTPKGHKETVDKYLKTLPPEQLAVKGSQAAQDRKQLLQKQIPIHDIDPTLCHELTEDELKKMNDYIDHIKQASVGVGQIVSLSSIIKGNLHKLNPNEAAIIASRYAKGVPLSEIVKLQSQNRASLLKSQHVNQSLDQLSINDSHNKVLPNYMPNSLNTTEQNLNPLIGNKIHDVNYPGYTRDINQTLPGVQFSNVLKPSQHTAASPQQSNYSKNLARGIASPNASPGHKSGYPVGQVTPHIAKTGSGGNELYENIEEMKKRDPQFLPNYIPGKYNVQSEVQSPMNVPKNVRDLTFSTYDQTNVGPNDPYKLQCYLPGAQFSSILKPSHIAMTGSGGNALYENIEEMKKTNPQYLPNYIPGKYNVQSEVQSPMKVPKNVKDLAFSTYDQTNVGPNDAYNTSDPNLPQNVSRQPGRPYERYPTGFGPESAGTIGKKIGGNNSPSRRPNIPNDGSYDQSGMGQNENEIENKTADPSVQRNVLGQPNEAYGHYPAGFTPESTGTIDNKTIDRNSPSGRPGDYYPSGFRSVQPVATHMPAYDQSPGKSGSNQSGTYPSGYPSDNAGPGGDGLGQNIVGHPPNVPYYPEGGPVGVGGNVGAHANKPNKKLSELHPGKISVDEDFLHPSQVTIGAIQDINYPEIKAATHGTNDFYEDYSPDSLKEILNNIILPDCHYCKKPFEENEFAITIDRANVLFHAECFKCAGCNQILADNVYFYNKETDNIYCGRDYAKIRGFPRCKACDELIFTKEYCLAENSTFHLKHFCCIECDRPLAGQDYTLEDEMPYCLPCFEQSKASKCNACCKVIKPDEIGCNLNGIHFHADDGCFACKMCKKPLMGKKLLLRNGKLYCSHDCFGADK